MSSSHHLPDGPMILYNQFLLKDSKYRRINLPNIHNSHPPNNICRSRVVALVNKLSIGRLCFIVSRVGVCQKNKIVKLSSSRPSPSPFSAIPAHTRTHAFSHCLSIENTCSLVPPTHSMYLYVWSTITYRFFYTTDTHTHDEHMDKHKQTHTHRQSSLHNQSNLMWTFSFFKQILLQERFHPFAVLHSVQQSVEVVIIVSFSFSYPFPNIPISLIFSSSSYSATFQHILQYPAQ